MILLIIAYGTVVGFVLSIPIGPVGILIFQDAKRGNRLKAYASMTGLILGELVYVVVYMVGLHGYILGSPVILNIAGVLGGSILLYLGYKSLFNREISHDDRYVSHVNKRYLRAITSCFAITIFNPAVLFIFVGVVSFYVENFQNYTTIWYVTILFISVQFGYILWYSLLIKISYGVHTRSSYDVQNNIQRISSLVLLAFGFYIFITKSLALYDLRFHT